MSLRSEVELTFHAPCVKRCLDSLSDPEKTKALTQKQLLIHIADMYATALYFVLLHTRLACQQRGNTPNLTVSQRQQL